jgi:hypothetical protein
MTASPEFLFRDRDIGRNAAIDNFSLPKSKIPVCRVRPIGALCSLDFGVRACDRFKNAPAMRLGKSWEDRYWHASS